ncbi:MAG: transcriptional regulator [Candidatus Poribacteria bacterium]|nr:transcriptional regulator [Candidatus Poribacteria bacterium]
MSFNLKEIQVHWSVVQPLFLIRNEKEYDKAVTVLNELIDEVGTDEKHSLYGLLDTLGTVIHAYEDKHHPIPECSGVEMLQFLMKEHQLKPSDLPELGTPDTVSEILEGKRELTVKHIHTLAVRFQVAPAVFV